MYQDPARSPSPLHEHVNLVELTHSLLQLSKDVAEMRATLSTIPDQKWLEHLEKVEALIACHDVSQAESLLAKMKEKLRDPSSVITSF